METTRAGVGAPELYTRVMARPRAAVGVLKLVGVYLLVASCLFLEALFVASGLAFGGRWTPLLAIGAACFALLPLAVAQAWILHQRMQATAPGRAAAVRAYSDEVAGLLATVAFLVCAPVLIESASGFAGVLVASTRTLTVLLGSDVLEPFKVARQSLATAPFAAAQQGALLATTAWLSALTLLCAAVCGAALWLRLRGVVTPGRLKRTFAVREPTVRAIGLAVVVGVTLGWLPAWLSHTLADQHAVAAIGAMGGGVEALLDFRTLDLSAVAWVVALTAALPLAEELAFRGFLWSAFARVGSTATTLGLSTLAFSLMHHDPSHLPATALIGLVLGLLRAHSRSVVPCVVAHVTLNALGVVAAGLSPAEGALSLAPAAVLAGIALLAAGSVRHAPWRGLPEGRLLALGGTTPDPTTP